MAWIQPADGFQHPKDRGMVNKNVTKNDLMELTIEDISSEGLGIGHASGMAVFVKDAVVGDRVLAKAVKVKKTYAYARLERILSPGQDRVAPRCAQARRCGGCQIQEMRYEAQLRLKERKVRENLVRIGGLRLEDDVFQPVIGMQDPWHYRNKAQFPVGEDRDGNIIAGFYAGRTHTIIDNHRCEIGIEENRPVLEAVLSWMRRFGVRPYRETDGSGRIRHVCIRAGFATKDMMVVIVANASGLKEEAELVRMLLEAVKEYHIRSIILNTNQEKTNVILGRKNRVLYGEDFIEDRIGSLTYRISAGSFYQVNPVQTAVLYRTALEYAALTGREVVWDLYCGTGTISLFLAKRAKRVIGIEVVPEAVENARQNARINQIDNCEFLTGKAEELAGSLPGADVIVVDPPRKGLDRTLVDTILSVAPERIVYVSCDSATLARDLALFVQGGWQVKKVQPVDQFCHSVHVECCVLLERERPDLKSDG